MNVPRLRCSRLALLLPLVLFGCSGASDPAPFPESSDLEQRLAADLGSPVFLELDGERSFVAPKAPTRVVASPDESTVGDTIRDWVQLYSSSLGIAADAISVAGQVRVPGGGFHVVLATNLPSNVASSGYGVDVMLDAEGRLVGLTSYANASANLVPKVTPEAAIATALRAVPPAEPSDVTGDEGVAVTSGAPEARLVYSPDGPDDARRLLYSVIVGDDIVWVDALSGEVVDVLPARSHLQAESNSWRFYSPFPYPDATKSRRIDYEQTASGPLVLQRAAQAATFWSPEKSRIEVGYMTGFVPQKTKSSTVTYKPLVAGKPSDFDLNTQPYVRGGKSPLIHGIGVDAMVEVSRADEFFQHFLLASPARRMKVVNGLPVMTNEPIQVVVHANYRDSDDKTGIFFDNAYHLPGSTSLFFGDGNATVSNNPNDVRPTVLSLDVVGHEMTHMWLDTRRLDVEASAIEEGLGDVVGQLLEHSVFQPLGEPTRPDRLGESSWVRTHGLRNLAQPEVGQANRVKGDESLQANHWTHRWCMLTDRQGKAVLDRRGQPQFDPAKVTARTETDRARRERCFYEAASVVGHAFYLMTFGGQNATSKLVVRNPIGWEKAQPLWLAMLVRAPIAGELRALVPPTFLDLAERQLAMARAVSPDTANAVGCAWEAVGVLRPGTTQGFTGKACTPAAPISCAGRRDGVYCDELLPFAAVECRGGVITGAPPPCPTGKVCRAQGGFINNPAIMTSEKVLTCFSPAE